jgi:hypothetical protein
MDTMQNAHIPLRAFLIPVAVALGIGAAWVVVSAYRNKSDGGRSYFRKNIEDLKAGRTNWLFIVLKREADSLLEEIRGMPEVEHVAIEASHISIVGMRHLGTLPNLKTVQAYYSEHQTGISDEGMLELRNCKKLEALFIYGGLTQEGVAEINRQMPNVRVITKHE